MMIDNITFRDDREYLVRLSPHQPMKSFSIRGGMVIKQSEEWTTVNGRIAKVLSSIQSNGRVAEANKKMGLHGHQEAFDIARNEKEVEEIKTRYMQKINVAVPGTAQRPNRMKVLPDVASESNNALDAISQPLKDPVYDTVPTISSEEHLDEAVSFLDESQPQKSKLSKPRKGGRSTQVESSTDSE
jgi:hypothetical protein